MARTSCLRAPKKASFAHYRASQLQACFVRSCLGRRLSLQCFDASLTSFLSRVIARRFDDDVDLRVRLRANESGKRPLARTEIRSLAKPVACHRLRHSLGRENSD